MATKKLNINTATVSDFENLYGIGRSKAEMIVKARENSVGFSSVNDLLTINGISQNIINQNRSLLHCKPLPRQQPNVTPPLRGIRNTTVQALRSKRKSKYMEVRPIKEEQSTSSTIPYRTRSSTHSQSIDAAIGSQKDIKTPNDVKVDLLPLFAGGRQTVCGALSKSRTEGRNGNISSQSRKESQQGTSVPGASTSSSGTKVMQNAESSRCFSSELRLPQSFCNSCEGTSTLRKTSVPGDGSSSSYNDSNEVPQSCTDLLVGEAVETEDNPSCSGSLHDVASCSQDEDSGISLRSRLPISIENVEKHWKKRKSEDRGEGCDSILKRKCQMGGEGESCVCESGCSETSDAHSSIRRTRIPSRKNPQPMLISWLKTFEDWGHAERLLALDELMEMCDPTQVRHLMQVIEPQFQRDFISLLPKELALYVLSFLEPRDLLRAAQTCSYWHTLAEDNILWREKCQEEGVSESLVFSRRRRVGPKLSWKALYLRQQQIERNWRTADRSSVVLKGHDDHVITCLEFSGNKIVSGSDDNSLKVWNAVTGKLLKNLTGHTGGVWSSQMSGNVVISGSTDRTLRVWNAETGKCTHTLYGHTSTVRCMHLHNRRIAYSFLVVCDPVNKNLCETAWHLCYHQCTALGVSRPQPAGTNIYCIGNKDTQAVVSGSRDATLRMWDIDTGHCVHILIGHIAAVRCVQYDGHRVVSGAYDYQVKIWDPETETCLQNLSGHTNRVYSLQFDGVHIVSGSLDTSIRVWNAVTGACQHTLIGHQSLTSGMELKDNILVSGNADSTVKVWNIATGQCLQTLQGPNKHQSAVTCLQFNRRLIITSSDDGTVKIWDLKSGEFIRNLVALSSGGSGGVVWRIRCNNTKLVCAVGSRNGTEETKLLVLDFDADNESDGSSNTPAVQ